MSERNQPESSTGTSFGALQTAPINTSPLSNQSPKLKTKSLNNGQESTMCVEEECTKCIEAVHRKLSWARLCLESEQDPQLVTSYLKVITSCLEAITVLRKFSL